MISLRFTRKTIAFSVATGVVLVAAIAGRWHHAARQHAVATRLRDAGVFVYYDFDVLGRSSWIRAWKRLLRGALGDDFVGDVEGVVFSGEGDQPAEPKLDELALLPGLRECAFSRIPVSNALIARTFTHAPRLTGIALSKANSIDGLVHAFSAFPELEGVRLDSIVFPGLARPRFSDIVKLKSVGITFAHVPGETIDDLARCSALTSLDLRGTDVTDDAIRRICALRNLERLYLDYTTTGDAGAEGLTTLQRLRYLSLVETSLSDVGLATLESLIELETLRVAGSRVTDMGLRRFERACPRCRIIAGEVGGGLGSGRR